MAYHIIGKYLVFTTRQDAEQFCKNQHYHGNRAAYVSTLNSHIMTSDPSPIVVNVTHDFPADYSQRGAIRIF